MAVYRQPFYHNFGGDGNIAGAGPLAYRFVSCSDGATGCPPEDPAPNEAEYNRRVARCAAEPPGSDYGLGEPQNLAWVDGYEGRSDFPYVEGWKVDPLKVCLDLFTFDFMTSGTIPPITDPAVREHAPWVRCGQALPGHLPPFALLDPAHPECICSEFPTHCVGDIHLTPHWASGCSTDPDPPHASFGNTCLAWFPWCNFAGDVFEGASGLCRGGTETGTTCPAGTVWDPVCHKCRSTTPPRPCWVWHGCRWVGPDECTYPYQFDNRHCNCFCVRQPCDEHSHTDYRTCTCVTCKHGECWCEIEQRCVTCDDPPCKTERSCVWDAALCDWDCNTPNCNEDGGDTYYYDTAACSCLPRCDPGECWCVGSNACVVCTDPDCKDELHCVWDPDICEWVCDSPPCVAPATWSGAPNCKCTGGKDGPWNLQTILGQYHATSADKGVRYQQAWANVPPFDSDVQVTTDPAHTQPRMIRDWRGRGLLLYRDAAAGGPYVRERVTDDDGRTWSRPRTIFVAAHHPMPAGPSLLTGCVVYAAYDTASGSITATRQYPGDTAPGAAFTFKDDLGVDLAVDDASFGLATAPDAPGRWLLHVLVSGALTHYESTDDCATFTAIP